MPLYGRNLILLIGGNLRPGENIKGWLRRISNETGVGFRSLERAWKQHDGYQSKNTRKKLEQAASEKRRDDVQRLVEETIGQILIWEAIDAEFHRPHIDAARAFITQLRAYQSGEPCFPGGQKDDQEPEVGG